MLQAEVPQYFHLSTFHITSHAQAMNIVFTPLSVSLCFLSALFLSSFLFPLFTSSSSLSFLRLNIINYDLHLRIIQTLCLHFSRSTPLRKILTVNHFLRIEYFQQPPLPYHRVINYDEKVPKPGGGYDIPVRTHR